MKTRLLYLSIGLSAIYTIFTFVMASVDFSQIQPIHWAEEKLSERERND